jgi:hypothetical protein
MKLEYAEVHVHIFVAHCRAERHVSVEHPRYSLTPPSKISRFLLALAPTET